MSNRTRRTSRRSMPGSASDRSRELWRMSASERRAAMVRGELSWPQLWEWAKLAPHEVPLIDDEFAFIAIFTPEVAEADRPER